MVTATFISALPLLGGCQDKLPTAPSELTTGVIIYEHANFIGESAHITADISDLEDVRGPCLAFEDNDPHDANYQLVRGPCSGTRNDCASSMRVFRVP